MGKGWRGRGFKLGIWYLPYDVYNKELQGQITFEPCPVWKSPLGIFLLIRITVHTLRVDSLQSFLGKLGTRKTYLG